MKLLGFNITREKNLPPLTPQTVLTAEAYRLSQGSAAGFGPGWNSVFGSNGVIQEPFPGAWQQNAVLPVADILWHYAVYACVTRIQSDIGKLRTKLVQSDDGVIWEETQSPSFSPVLKKPNRYQTHIDFKEQWIGSKLIHGNAYILKERDERNIVVKLYVLDPTRIHPLVAPDGDVFYQLSADNLAGIENSSITVPASEIIHDKYKPLYHPLCGISPLRACIIAASSALNIQNGSSAFFANGQRPGGILTAPTAVNQEIVDDLKRQWETGFSGNNRGKVAVLGWGLKYEPLHVDAHDAQLIEQLKISCEAICSAFHIPPFIIGCGPLPANATPEILMQIYYNFCLQNLIETMEVLLDEGLALPEKYGTELDIDNLLRMDSRALIDAEAAAIKGALKSTDEGRRRIGLGKVPGGADIRGQQQDYSIAALAERDRDKPFAKPAPATPAVPAADVDTDDDDDDEEDPTRALIAAIQRKTHEARRAA